MLVKTLFKVTETSQSTYSKQRDFHYCLLESKELNFAARENAELPWHWVRSFNSGQICSVSLCCSGHFSYTVSSFLSLQTSPPYFLCISLQGCHDKVPQTVRLQQQKLLVSPFSGLNVQDQGVSKAVFPLQGRLCPRPISLSLWKFLGVW